jgi:hypothetical protein
MLSGFVLWEEGDPLAKEFAAAFYHSARWYKCRRAFIQQRVQIDGGMCQMCHKNLGYIVDHIKELTPDNITDPEISLNHGNLQYLCHDCHNTKTFGGGLPVADGLMFDEDGNIVKRTDCGYCG